MEKLKFDVILDATPMKVWDVLWNDASYREWTSVFSEGSHVQTDWQEGSKALFLDGSGHGMVSQIHINKPNELMSFKHLGNYMNGVEDTSSAEVQKWSGALETYKLTPVDGDRTKLEVELDMNDEFKDYFMGVWPKAFEKIKALSEG